MDERLHRLRRYNIGLALLHTVQVVALLLLANDFSLPVVATFLEQDPAARAEEVPAETLFDVRIGPLIALFLAISAVDHALMAFGPTRRTYERDLARGRNDFRWYEYALSASVMIVVIAMLAGVADVAALIALFGVNATMLLFGLLMERYETPEDTHWLPYWFGVFAGAVPWVVIALYIWSPTTSADPPAFVYGIFVSLFVLFNSFAVNMVLQYRQVGPWRDYLFGEAAYGFLSLTAKSALAWQVFAGTLR